MGRIFVDKPELEILEVNLFDTIFRHCGTSSAMPPRRLHWIREQWKWAGSTVFTDDLIASPVVLQVICPKKFLWLVESREVKKEAYGAVLSCKNRFDKILTHDRGFLENDPQKFIFAIPGSQREIQQNHLPVGVFPKSKQVSTITSPKVDTVGHRFRHEVIRAIGSRMDLLGRAYKPIQFVTDGLSDYRYSVTIENAHYDYYFTEKLLNCFFTGTVPIYWGCPSISKFFDINGIIKFEKIEDLPAIFDSLSEADYNSRLPAIHENFRRAQEYISAEEWIYDHLRDLLR